MNRKMWRQLASGLVVATLSMGIAACDDDTTSNGGDMAVSQDMSANADMTANATPGSGQLTLADVVGTVFSPSLPGGAAPRTHTLVALASLPKIAGTPDPTSNFGVTPTIHGCSIYRYNATNVPGPDGDAGDVTMSGWNDNSTIAVNATNGSASASPMASNSPITCRRVGPLMQYTCFFAGTANPDGGAMGAKTDDVIFPLFKHRSICVATGATIQTYPDWPAAYPCIERYVAVSATTNADICPSHNGQDVITTACEQSPILPLGVSQITQTIAGGADWPATMDTLGNGGGTDGGTSQLAGPLYVISVTSGTTNITGTDPVTKGPSLSMADAAINPANDLTINFSCDGSTTVGGGCAGSSDLIGVLIKTSTSQKTAFSTTTASGVGTCSQPVAVGGTVTVKANQLAALLGGQTGGSWQIALVRLTTHLKSPAGTHPLLAFTAGMGVFGFTNQ